MLMAKNESFASAQGFGFDVPPMGWNTKYAIDCKEMSADAIKG